MDRLTIALADWTEAGEQLLRCDPLRYAAILVVVRDIVAIHKDPLVRLVSDDETDDAANIVRAAIAERRDGKRGAA